MMARQWVIRALTAVALLPLLAAPPARAQAPGIALTVEGAWVDGNGNNRPDAGEAIEYKYTLANTGGATLTNVTVTDPEATITGGPATLNPGAEDAATFSGSRTITQADIDGGAVHCTASVEAEDGSGGAVSAAADAQVALPRVAGIAIATVTADSTTAGDGLTILAGEPVEWKYTVTNTGNVTLSGIAVSDSGGVAVAAPVTTLSPGEAMAASASGTVVPGNYSNMGTVTAQGPDGAVCTASDPSGYFGADPRVSLVAQANGSDGLYIHVGSPVVQAYTVTNTGNVPLTNVTVTDADLGVVCDSISLAAGASATCTSSCAAVAGPQVVIGGVAADYTDGAFHSRTVSDSDASSYFGSAPALSVVGQVIDGSWTEAYIWMFTGETAIWQYTVTNTGNVPLTGIVVADARGLVLTAPATGLEVGQSTVVTASSVTTAATIISYGAASGYGPAADAASATSNVMFCAAIDPKIAIATVTVDGETSGDGLTIAAGEPIKWHYTVRNTGNERLADVVVSDSDPSLIPVFISGDANNNHRLDTSETWVFEAAGTAIAGPYANTGTVSARSSSVDSAGHTSTVTASDASGYTGLGGTPPVISTPGDLTLAAASSSGAVAAFDVTATDDVDGPVVPIVSPASGSLFPLGTTTVNCSAGDAAGNTATASFLVTVAYSWSGFLKPATIDGSTSYKAGSTVAVKFALTGASAGVSDATARFRCRMLGGTEGPGGLFRYAPVDNQYIYTWSTKGLARGLYEIAVDLGDGVPRTAIVRLR